MQVSINIPWDERQRQAMLDEMLRRVVREQNVSPGLDSALPASEASPFRASQVIDAQTPSAPSLTAHKCVAASIENPLLSFSG